ncbi:MAG: hypothetical protein EOP54_19585, partial [Sphingobacteriales bacterium]
MKAKSNIIKKLSAAAFITGVFAMQASDIKVGNSAELNSAIGSVKPGDRIIMANGTWKDTAIAFTANGTVKD